MEHKLTRRNFLWSAAGIAAAGRLLHSQEPAQRTLQAVNLYGRNSTVALIQGESRRKTVCESLVAVADRILPVLKRKKYVVIKPNIVNTVNQLASTHADALHGILDFLAPRFKGPVVIAESSAGYTLDGYNNFGYY
jgi:hypothetical protein